MSDDPIGQAREFVKHIGLPDPPAADFASPKSAAAKYDPAKGQAAVVGADVVAFARGVTPEQRNDIVNAALLAQLAAKKKVAEPRTLTAVKQWYTEYFDVLSHIGFAIQDQSFAEYQQKSETFEAHEAILEVAAVLLAAAPAALALVKTTLEALQKASTGSAWITLFNRESQSANTARFQMSLIDEGTNGLLLMSLLAFGLQARTALTQVLFFKFHSNDVTLHYHSGKVAINGQLLAGARQEIAQKLVAYTKDYIRALPEL